jgi:hypothetical protein
MPVIMRKQIHIAAVTFAALVPLLVAVALTAATPSGKISPHAVEMSPAWDEGDRPAFRQLALSSTHRTWRYLSE